MNTAVMERPPLVSITGTVVHISPAPAANRSGKIKLDNGAILSAFPDKLQQVAEGHAYDFGCVETNKGGVIYRDVKAVRFLPQPETFRAPAQHAPAIRPAPQQQQRTAPVNQHVDPPQPTHNGNGNGNYNRQTSPRDAERMFVCSTLNAFIQTGRVKNEVAELIAYVSALRQVWQETFGQDE